MSLKDQINSDLKDAMKSKDQLKLAVVRAIRTEILKKEKEKAGTEITDEIVLKLIETLSKQRKDSIRMFEEGGRPEKAEEEKAELEVLLTYLPEELSAEEIEEIVKAAIEQTGASSPQDMGKLMGPVMGKCKATGKTVDGKKVNEVVKALLNS